MAHAPRVVARVHHDLIARTDRVVWQLDAVDLLVDPSVSAIDAAVDPNVRVPVVVLGPRPRDALVTGTHSAKDAYELDAHDGILTWVSDPAGHGRSDQVMAARIDNVAPVALTPTPHGDLTGSAWPATGDGFVAWRSDWLGLKVPARLAVWSPGMLAAVGIGGTAAVGMVGIRDGWVVWFTEYDEYADPPTPAMIAGIRVADLAAALNRGS